MICSVSTLKIPYEIKKVKEKKWNVTASHDGLYLSLYTSDPAEIEAVYQLYNGSHSLSFVKRNKVIKSISREIGYST
jgi:hypothetical protein